MNLDIDFVKLAEMLFPDVDKTCEEIEALYPPRQLAEGAKVTRFAPSPTGFVHLGGMYQALTDERLAHGSGGVFYLRIEDTDSKRAIEGATENIILTLEKFGIKFDEGVMIDENGKLCDKGSYAPYKQSERAFIYHVYAKKLVSEGKAYPVFTTKEELEALKNVDKKLENKIKDWESEAAESLQKRQQMRQFTLNDVDRSISEGLPFVLRILSDGDPEKKTVFVDQIKGKLEIPENDEDFVLLKSDGIPTYHFAHAVDDHLMCTTHVIRGEEWLPSMSKHIMLFRYLGFKMPKYLHTAQIMHIDENGNKKKLSKRDMGFNMNDYDRMGYDSTAVCEYILTLLNSNYEEWRMQNPDKPYTEFPFGIKKMSPSGCLFDTDKLKDVSKNVLSRLSADEIYKRALEWAKKYDEELAGVLKSSPEYAIRIFSIGRGGKKPRKDLAVWSDVKPYISLFYDELFDIIESYPDEFDKKVIADILSDFSRSYNPSSDSTEWFELLKVISSKHGFSPDVKAYKAAPASFVGHVGDVGTFLRIAITGKTASPDLYEIMQIIGYERVIKRLDKQIKAIKQGE